MKKKWFSLAVCLLVSLLAVSAVPAAGKKAASSAKKIVLTPTDVQWQQGPAAIPGSLMAVLEGNPQKRGFFVARLKLPAGTKIQPHVHENIERVTVISGKINLAMGEKAENPTELPAGSYFSLPPKLVHNAWVDEETVLQISTSGPWSMKLMKKMGQE